MSQTKGKICFVSVDIEHDYGSGHAKTFRGVECMEDILDMMKRLGVSSTLFITGEVLEKYPELVKEWSKNHEIACHSYSHTFFDLMHIYNIREELERFVNLYKKVLNTSPRGFRAPSHIIHNSALRAVNEAGFYYDSSIVPHYPPFKKYRGYLGNAPKAPYYPNEISCRRMGDMNILEIPVTGHLFGMPLAGAWIRGIPFWVYKLLFFAHKPRYISFSFHSWDMLHDHKFFDKLDKILNLFQKYGYQFKRGDEIVNSYELSKS